MPPRKFTVDFGTLDQDVINQIMGMQKRDLEAARSRKGRQVSKADAVELLFNELDCLRANLMNCPALLATSLTREHYPPCDLPLDSLKAIQISDLVLEGHHLGSCLIAKLVVDPVEFHAALAIIEDEKGDYTRLQIYNTDFSLLDANYLPKNSIIAIKEPYYEVLAHNRQTVRVDHPSNVLTLNLTDSRVPHKWREKTQAKSSKEFKTEGNNFVARKDWSSAECSYTEGLENLNVSEDFDLSKALHLNRALTRLVLGRFEGVLQDTEKVLNVEKHNEKALFRSAQAYYKMEMYQKSISRLKSVLKHYPQNKEARILLDLAENRLLEGQKGHYNIPAMLRAVTRTPRLDAATYIGAAVVKSSTRHGRGLFARSSFAAGELISCERACIGAWKGEKLMSKFAEAVGDFNSGKAVDTYQHVSTNQMISSSFHNPTFHLRILQLCDGKYPRTGNEGKLVDDRPVIDAFLLRRIFELNAFGCPRKSSDDIAINNPKQAQNDTSRVRDSGGIWWQMAFTNHSCLPNSHASFIGDMMILRATRDISEGEEILISYVRPNLDYQSRKEALSKWGFECNCELCAADKKDDAVILKQRNSLLAQFTKIHQSLGHGNMNTESTDHGTQILDQLEATYQENVWGRLPKPHVFSPYLKLASFYTILAAKESNPDEKVLAKVEELALKALQALGYEIKIGIEGLQAPDRAVGLCVGEAIDSFLCLANAQYGIGRARLVPTFMREVALTYKIICGEDWSLKERLGAEMLRLETDNVTHQPGD